MRTEIALFGRRFEMAHRARRRRLVVLFYGIFGALLGTSWLIGSRAGAGWVTIEFTILVGPILGGYFYGNFNLLGARGLVEPFAGNTMIARRAGSSKGLPLGVENIQELQNDERALLRRNAVHYVAHRFLGTLAMVAFLLEFYCYSVPHRFYQSVGLSVGVTNAIVYLLLQVAYISYLTLPQAILLWNEPDMEAPE